MTELVSNIPIYNSNPEEELHYWWQERFGENIPEDVKSRLRKLLQNAVAKAHIEEHTLGDQALQQVYDSRRLCQTKLDNIEESMMRVRRQKEHLHKFITMNAELTELRQHLYALKKEQASFLNSQRELERFEEFEAVNGRFQRIRTLEQNIQQARQRQAQLSQEIETVRKQGGDAERKLIMEQKKTEDAENALSAAALLMTEVERQDTIISESEREYSLREEQLSKLNERSKSLQKEIQEKATASEAVKQEIVALGVQEQTLDVHKSMLIRSEAVLTMLDEFLNISQQRDELSQKLAQTMRRQEERDEQLSRLFTENQSLNAKIDSKKEEAEGHRRGIAGQDSYNLQRRALDLRSRKLMLETASSLWRNIAAGFDLIEQEQQAITQLRLHADHLNHDIDRLETDTRQIGKQLDRKLYQLTLSKSQNVIELRGDLKEGLPCSVCGATHHPWYGESITEQNALINTLKAECDASNIEHAGKQRELQEKKDELIVTQTQLKLKAQHLESLQNRQKKDVIEWQNFSHLDRSFSECSPSTNREARTTLLGLLIEKTTVDAEEAEKELNAFTFHLDAISTIGAVLQKLQQQAADLAIRLNEVNTACQVMAGQVERMEQRQQAMTKDYSRRYEVLEHIISIPDWFHLWKASPENVKYRIQKMREEWEDTKKRLQAQRHQAAVLQEQAELLQRNYAETSLDILDCENKATAIQEQRDKAESAQQKLLPNGDGKGFFTTAQKNLEEQKKSLATAINVYDGLRQDLLTKQAEWQNQEAIIHEQEASDANERRELDQWMQRYNASHPPVQMTELERVLADDKEWGNIRKQVRENQVKITTTQDRIDYLCAQIVALQAEGLRPVEGNGDTEQQQLQAQLTEFGQQQRNVLMQLAHYDEQIRLHEQAVKRST